MRRGNQVDFIPSQMLPGEWAISQDNEKIYMCFTPGRVIEIGSVSSILPYIQDAEAWAVGQRDGEDVEITDVTYHNNSKYYAGISKDNSDASKISADNAATSELNAKQSEDNAKLSEDTTKDYKEWVENAFNEKLPEVSIDFTTGNLLYIGGVLTLDLNTVTGMLEWYM